MLHWKAKILLEVLSRLRDKNLCIAPDKCEWRKDRIEFLDTSFLEMELK